MKLLLNIFFSMLACNYAEPQKTYNVHYSSVAPSSYICLCIPSSHMNHVKDNNKITDWDGECSNDQVCIWNDDQVLIKYWYTPKNME